MGVGVGADVHVGVGAPPDGAPPPGLVGHAVVSGPVSEHSRPEREPAPAELVLAPMPPLDVARRGFFAKDTTRLELTLVDRSTLAPLWVKTVEDDVDPRDADGVRALLDRALEDPAGWEPAAPAP